MPEPTAWSSTSDLEMAEVKRRYPRHVVIASLMVESKRETWHDIVRRSEDAGADGLELNFRSEDGGSKAPLPAPRGHRFAHGGEQTRDLARHCSALRGCRSRRLGAQL